MGPQLLGKAAWKIVEGESPESWEAFKREVEVEFGIPGLYKGRHILDLKKMPHESDVDFIQRAEQTRKRMRVAKEKIFCLVWRDLSYAYRQKMDDELERVGGTEITWDLLV